MEKKILTENKKHKKHANLAKPEIGKFARNEWAFIGAPCNIIRHLVEELNKLAAPSSKCIFIDESHNHDDVPNSLAITTKKGEAQEFTAAFSWSKNENHIIGNNFDFCFVNGNHFKASKQIVILDERKKESLSRKLDRLSDVRAFILTDTCQEPYDFLRDNNENDQLIPKIHISEVNKIWELIKQEFKLPPVKALILAGGKSLRMGRDKGKINYHGKAQREFLYDLMNEMVDEVYLSCRSDQAKELKAFKTIEDKLLGMGPFGAIVSAFMSDPNAAWLVIPCDLPLLGKDEIRNLIKHRTPYKFATAFLNRQTGFPEPLISIWEPKIYQRLLLFLSQGYSCPRKVLINTDVVLIDIQDQKFMMNVNTPEDYDKASIIIEES